MTEIRCLACGLPWNLLAGRFPQHISKGSPCPMSGRTLDEGLLSPSEAYTPTTIAPVDKAADPKPARKVRSDKGAKRGQRKGGGESHAPPGHNRTEGSPEPTQWTALATTGSNTPEEGSRPETRSALYIPVPSTLAKPQRKPRSDRAQYIAVTSIPIFPSQTTAEQHAEKELGELGLDATYTIYQVHQVASVTKGIQVRRIGRVRKAKS